MHEYPPPPRERLDTKSLEHVTAAKTVDECSFWLDQAEIHGAPTRARVAVLKAWCLLRAMPDVARIAGAS